MPEIIDLTPHPMTSTTELLEQSKSPYKEPTKEVRAKFRKAVQNYRRLGSGSGWPPNEKMAKLVWIIMKYPHLKRNEQIELAGYKSAMSQKQYDRARYEFAPFRAEIRGETVKARVMSKGAIDRELTRLAFFDPLSLYKLMQDDDGNQYMELKFLHEMSEEQRKCIKKINTDRDGNVIGYEFHDKVEAMDKLMQSMGLKSPEFISYTVGQLITKTGDTNVQLNMSDLSDDQLKTMGSILQKAIPNLE